MTESAFIQLHLNGDIDFNNAINVNYDVDDSTPFHGTITGITISPTALSIDGSTTGTDITGVLEEVTTVSFSFTFAGESPVSYTLEILERSFFPNANGNSFFYFPVTPVQINQTLSDQSPEELNANQDIVFEPYIQDLTFGFSNFNPLIGNASNAVVSNDYQVADRSAGSFILPKNFDALLAGTATKASVQESNYSATGWTNSRYEGSVSSKANYGGVDPALLGRTFEGSVYDDDTNPAAVYLAQSRISKNYFHTGGDKLPLFTTSSMTAKVGTQVAALGTTLNFGTNPPLTGSLNVGELLALTNNRGIREIVKITNNDAFLGGANNIQIKRQYFQVHPDANGNTDNGANDGAIPATTELFKIDDVKLFEFTDGTSNLSAIYKAIVYVGENKSISFTDEFGVLVSQSFGETSAYILPD